jgi:hypothetical protein
MRKPRIERMRRKDARLVPEIPLGQAQADAGDSEVKCPGCRNRVALAPMICSVCGFPFLCDLEQPGDRAAHNVKMITWRTLLGLAAIVFLLTSGVFSVTSSHEYNGYTTQLISTIQPDTESGIPINGPEGFKFRVQMALGMLKLRAADYYWRLQDSVTSIEYLDDSYWELTDGRRIELAKIGGLAQPATGRVMLRYNVAFQDGPQEFWDRTLFNIAGVLIHEMRHIELHTTGRNPGGWQEEALCEEAAYLALKQCDAPGGVLVKYEVFLRNPHHPRYQDWYDWYKQWE